MSDLAYKYRNGGGSAGELAREVFTLQSENERLLERLTSLRRSLRWIADPSYIGNYSDSEVIGIYRKWAAAVLAWEQQQSMFAENPKEAA